MTQISELLDEMRAMRAAVERVARLLARVFEPDPAAARAALEPDPDRIKPDPIRCGVDDPYRLLASNPCLLHGATWCAKCWGTHPGLAPTARAGAPERPAPLG